MAYGAITWFGQSERRARAWTIDRDRPDLPSCLTTPIFLRLLELETRDRLKGYEQIARRAQIVTERKAKFWHLWWRVEETVRMTMPAPKGW